MMRIHHNIPVFGHAIIYTRSSLVSNEHNVPDLPPIPVWGPRQRRTYQRLLSGLTRARKRGDGLRILTLTSSPASPGAPGDRHSLTSNFQVLRKRILKKFGLKIDYFRLRTNEGPDGVLHVIYKGGYIPQSWLSRMWEELHKAPIVYIQRLRGPSRRIANYLISNYMSSHHGFTRLSWSWGWVFRGFVKTWKSVLDDSANLLEGIRRWNILMGMRDPLKWYSENRKTKRWRDVGGMRSLFAFVV